MKRSKDDAPVTILLAEDDRDQASIYKMRFKAIGIEVTLVHHGEEALTYLEQQPIPDLIITDIMMPVMDGHELVTQIRATEAIRHLPIIVLTAVTDVDNKTRFAPLSIADFCEKTLRWRMFQDRVTVVLKREGIITG